MIALQIAIVDYAYDSCYDRIELKVQHRKHSLFAQTSDTESHFPDMMCPSV